MEITKEVFARTMNDTAIYSTEAYYSISGSLLPMSSFAAELLEARIETDIESICTKYNFTHKPFSPCADPRTFIRGLSTDWKFKSTDDFVPSYESWLLERMKTISFCLQLYSVCIPIVRKTTKNSETTDMFNVLYHAQKTHQQMVSEAFHNYEWIPYQDIRERRTKFSLRALPKFPLAALFEAFQSEVGYRLQEHYGYTFKQMRRRGDQSPPQSQYHYWENPAAYAVARDRLWGYVSQHRTDNDNCLLKWNVQELASMYLDILDRYVEGKLSGIRLHLDSPSGTAGLVADDLNTALNLWLFTQIQAKTDYRVCKMCGRLFVPRAQKGKKYCDLHKKYEVNYYNQTVSRFSSASDSDGNE